MGAGRLAVRSFTEVSLRGACCAIEAKEHLAHAVVVGVLEDLLPDESTTAARMSVLQVKLHLHPSLVPLECNGAAHDNLLNSPRYGVGELVRCSKALNMSCSM